MVDKRANVKTWMNLFFGIILVVVLLAFVFAAATTWTGSSILVDGGNYSTALNISITVNGNIAVNNMTNITCWYNASGGAAQNASLLVQMRNITVDQTVFNASVDISEFTSSRIYNISCDVRNETGTDYTSNLTLFISNVTIDTDAPAVNFTDTSSSITNYGNYTSAALGNVSINVSFSDAIWTNKTLSGASVYINVTDSDGLGGSGGNFTRLRNNHTISANPSWGIFFNGTIDVTNFDDGVYYFTIFANDSIYLKNALGVVSANLNNTERIQITLDNTAPASVTLTKANSTRDSLGIDIAIVDAGSGVGSACTVVGTGTTSISGASNSQALAVTGLSCSGTYDYVVTCIDRVGKSKASVSTSFMTDSCSSGTSGPGTTTPVIEKTQSWASISPGVPALLTDFEGDVGLKQIRIEVKSEVQDVRMIVSSHQSNPSTVAVDQLDIVYRYLEIETQNLGEELERATIRAQVEKTWVANNDFTKEGIAIFKIGEEDTEWQELVSTYLEEEEDDTYYYYDVEVDSFSYFAIGEKVTEEEEEEEEPEPTNLLWLWITLGVVVVAIIIGGGFAAKKRR